VQTEACRQEQQAEEQAIHRESLDQCPPLKQALSDLESRVAQSQRDQADQLFARMRKRIPQTSSRPDRNHQLDTEDQDRNHRQRGAHEHQRVGHEPHPAIELMHPRNFPGDFVGIAEAVAGEPWYIGFTITPGARVLTGILKVGPQLRSRS
jgi:hypothetical protein